MNDQHPEAAVPEPAATVVLARDQEKGLQVLLLKRSAKSRFMGGNYVFPGGRVETADYNVDLWQPHLDLQPDVISRRHGGDLTGDEALANAIAAIRETFEEAGVLLACRHNPYADELQTVWDRRLAGELSPDWLQKLLRRGQWILQPSRLFSWSRWITPEKMRYRYDTRFFVARMPEDQVCLPDMQETVHSMWISPGEALWNNLAGKIPLSPPTLVTLHEMLPCARLQNLEDAATKRRCSMPLKPRLISDGKEKIILEPWDPEYHRSQVRIDVSALRLKIASVGKSFSRLWFSDGVWIPIAG